MKADLTIAERAFLAGFLDGDGCISITKQNRKDTPTPEYSLSVIFTQAQREMLERWRQRTGYGRVYHCRSTGQIKATKPMYHWRITAKQAERILCLMIPYLDIKHAQAETALEFRKTFGTQGGDGYRYLTPRATLDVREQCLRRLQDLKRGEAEEITWPERPEQLSLM